MEVKLFGILADKAGATTLELEGKNIDELREALKQHITDAHKLSFGVAVNRILVNENLELNGNEEVAFLPPFAGG